MNSAHFITISSCGLTYARLDDANARHVTPIIGRRLWSSLTLIKQFIPSDGSSSFMEPVQSHHIRNQLNLKLTKDHWPRSFIATTSCCLTDQFLQHTSGVARVRDLRRDTRFGMSLKELSLCSRTPQIQAVNMRLLSNANAKGQENVLLRSPSLVHVCMAYPQSGWIMRCEMRSFLAS